MPDELPTIAVEVLTADHDAPCLSCYLDDEGDDEIDDDEMTPATVSVNYGDEHTGSGIDLCWQCLEILRAKIDAAPHTCKTCLRIRDRRTTQCR